MCPVRGLLRIHMCPDEASFKDICVLSEVSFKDTYVSLPSDIYVSYRVATISRLLKMIGLFCEIQSLL